MPSIALVPAVHLSPRQVLRNYRMSVLASTPFIGPRGNNFSHKFQERFRPPLPRPDSTCPGSVHLLSQDAPTTVPMRFNRCTVALHPFVPIRSSRPGYCGASRQIEKADSACAQPLTRALRAAKKSAARGSPLAATGIDNNRICSLPVSLRSISCYCPAPAPNSSVPAPSSTMLCGPAGGGAAPCGAAPCGADSAGGGICR